ncbi:DUF378 domain-containing protein [Romboutsia maritimum]|uniref:DUF378 domain-containing protein n=1 Tax=Romboutsia maritimum TaxID=2020948 RepID=A0A371IT15_9FIRM|nr:DUF378 domain-containing protein [Romboutsia maritimum]RDY23626.1 DUF378 domain-containing protein [Romboutsia maritimum]
MKKFALVLVIIGAFGVDLLGNIFEGTYELASRIIYFLVGLAGIYLIPTLMTDDNK